MPSPERAARHGIAGGVEREPHASRSAVEGAEIDAPPGRRLGREHGFESLPRLRKLCGGLGGAAKILVQPHASSINSTPVTAVTARRLFAPLGPTYDRYSALLSFGQDPRWRRFLVARVDAGSADTVLDVATGTGLVARELVRHKGCAVVGI